MKRFFLFFILIPFYTNGQYCTSDEMRASHFLQNRQLKKAVEIREARLEGDTKNFVPARGIVYTIPVVFHVIHNYGVENISDEQIYDAVRIVNMNYRKQNPDTTDIIPAFKSIAADCEIELRLAQIDPNGNCTKGINRIASATTYTGGHEVKNLVHWDPTKYLNIYIVANAAGLAGHAVWPSDADTIPAWDGIVIKHDYVGSIGTSSQLRSVVLSHELGHYLNLHHIWGGNNVPGFYYLPVGDAGNCSFDDLVTDTPNTIGWSVCSLNGSSCGNTVDNVQNFMDYAYCARMLTEGQKTRMHACLNSSIAGRNNLWQPANLIATGTDGTDYLCAAEFTSDKKRICAGSDVLFTDLSYHGATARQWNFSGGSPASSTDSVISVTYPSAGQWNVELTAGNGSASFTQSTSNYITVHSNTGIPLPYFQDFESITGLNFSNSFYVENPQSDATFEIISNAGNSGMRSVTFDLLSTPDNYTDELILGPFDASSLSQLQLAFYYAYCMRDTITGDDQLKISVSGDCGQTWTIRKTLNATSLTTAPSQSPSFIPASSQWIRTTVTNISASYLTGSFMIKFSFTSGNGNRFYLDDINLAANVGTGELNNDTGFSVFPNPASKNISLNIESIYSCTTILNVKDLTGRIIMQFPLDNIVPGTTQSNIDISELPSGVYLLELEGESKALVKKIIKY